MRDPYTDQHNDERAREIAHLNRSKMKHRREMAFQVYLPIGGTAAILLIVALGLLINFDAGQVSTVAACMSIFITLPLVLLCFIPYLLIVALAYGAWRIKFTVTPLLASLRQVVYRVNQQMPALSQTVTRPIFWLQERLATIENFLGIANVIDVKTKSDYKDAN